jgi:chemotaxis methyl-accepting protein methylase
MPVDQVIAILRERHGLDVSCYDESYLARTVEKRGQGNGVASVAGYLARLREDGAEAAALARALRVSYSDFFRNPLAFAWLEQVILTAFVEGTERAARGEIRVWSAACAAGQEAWSVAILLDERVAGREPQVPYRVFATDVSEPDVDQARRAVYPAAALGNVRGRHLGGAFVQQGDAFSVIPRLRAQVEFSVYDLLGPGTTCPPASIYGDFDLVLCSNVLLYFRPEVQHRVLGKLRRSLAPGGYLIVGETERPIVEGAGGFRAVAPSASVFQKRKG